MPLGVSATFVIVFLIFGGFLEKSGAGEYFMDLARALMGTKPGGPAQIAVVSSCLFGSISGSAVANVYGTGTFTIPLMKRIGYSPTFSGAVEAAASTGGQIMPPVMGAGAFLMASFLGVQYKEVMIGAILPAFMYYGALLLMVRLTALRNHMQGLKPEELPRIKDVVRRMYLIIPIVGVVYMLLDGASPMKAGIVGIVLCWVVSLPDPQRRMGPRQIPVLIKLGFAPLAAHMFVFYYAIISNITPPVALAAYAASSVAQSPPNSTGFQAMKLGCIGFLVPFAFCYDAGLLMLGDTMTNMLSVYSGIISVMALGGFWVGYAFAPLNMFCRATLILGGIAVFAPQAIMVLIGSVLVIGVWIFSYFEAKKDIIV